MNPFPIDVIIAPNDPNIWDIATAVGTVATVAVALFIGLLEQRRASRRQREELVRLERERDVARAEQAEVLERAEKEERERQARRVAIWNETRGRVRSDDGTGDWLMRTEVVVVHNYSDMPIFRVLPMYRDPDGESQVADIEGVLLPGAELRAPLPERPFDAPHRETDGDYVLFNDVYGRLWRRTMTGDLAQIQVKNPD